jgi:hypothetical protein
MKKDKRRSGATGPTSEEGKATCSLNRLDHGCRSEQLIVKGENREDYDALRAQWFNQYPVRNFAITEMLEDVVRTAWMLRRTLRNEDQIQEKLAETPALEWSKADHDKLNLFARYVRNAETSYNRALRALREMQKHDAYLRDREERRCREMMRDVRVEIDKILKTNPRADITEREKGYRILRQMLRNIYFKYDEYIPEHPDDEPKGDPYGPQQQAVPTQR